MSGVTRLALIVTAATAVPAVAGADDAGVSPRPVRGGAGAGWFASVSGPDHGPVFEAELYPGGALGRFGARAEHRGFEELGRGWVLGGLTFEAAAARPRLQIALHVDAGATYPDPRPVVGGGVQTQLWIVGPIAIGTDGTAALIVDGIDTELLLGGALTLRIAR